jgi:hypothetical protein
MTFIAALKSAVSLFYLATQHGATVFRPSLEIINALDTSIWPVCADDASKTQRASLKQDNSPKHETVKTAAESGWYTYRRVTDAN